MKSVNLLSLVVAFFAFSNINAMMDPNNPYYKALKKKSQDQVEALRRQQEYELAGGEFSKHFKSPEAREQYLAFLRKQEAAIAAEIAELKRK